MALTRFQCNVFLFVCFVVDFFSVFFHIKFELLLDRTKSDFFVFAFLLQLGLCSLNIQSEMVKKKETVYKTKCLNTLPCT